MHTSATNQFYETKHVPCKSDNFSTTFSSELDNGKRNFIPLSTQLRCVRRDLGGGE